MTTFSTSSTLLDDVYLHHAVDVDGTARAVLDPTGRVSVVSVGTDGHVRRMSQVADDDTGWQTTDLGTPGRIDVLDVALGPDGSLVVCGGTSSTRAVHVLSVAADGTPGRWTTLPAAPEVAGRLTFLDLVLRRTATGLEFFLLYLQRMEDTGWGYTYRIGRAATTAGSWSIGMSLGTSYSGIPGALPTMTLHEVQQKPTLSLCWNEASRIRSWTDLDGTPTSHDVRLPDGSDVRALIAPSGVPGDPLFLVGGWAKDHPWGLYSLGADGALTCLAPCDSAVSGVAWVYDDDTGLDVMGRTDTDGLVHVQAGPDLTLRRPWQTIDERVVDVAGVNDPEVGATFFTTTRDRRLVRRVRSAPGIDWELATVDVTTGTGSQVVWYTTRVSVLDDTARALPDTPVTIRCAEATEIYLGGRPEVVGPRRPLSVRTSTVGNLVIRQSTAQLSNLYVPPLELSLDTGERVVLTPYASTEAHLYDLTAPDLLAAAGRDGTPLLPEDRRKDAAVVAEQLATCASLGRPPRATWATPPTTGATVPADERVVFTPVGGAPMTLGLDLGDFFEGIKDGVLGAFDVAVRAVGDDVVTGLYVTIDAAEGAYEVFVNRVEHAFDAVRTVLEAVGAAFEVALEWLGTLLDWTAISELAGQVRGQVREGLAGVPAVMAAAGLPGSIPAHFDELRTSADAAFAWLRSEIGTDSTGAATRAAGFTDLDAVFTFGGTNVSNTATWLLDRLVAQLGQARSVVSVDGPGWASVAELGGVVEQQLATVGAELAAGFESLFLSLETADDVLGVLVGTLLDQMQGLVVRLLDAVESMAGALVTTLTSTAQSSTLQTVLDTRFEIPGLGDVLAVIGLGGTTLLDLISYLVAVPVHVVSTVLGVDDVSGPTATPVGVYLAAAVLFVVILVLSAANDALPEGKAVLAVLASVVWVALTGMVFFGIAKADDPPPELVIAALFYLGYQVVGLRTNARHFGEKNPTRYFAIYSIVDAAFMNVLAAVWAIRTQQDPDPKKHPKSWQITANVVGTLPDLFKWPDLVWVPPEQSRPPWVRAVVVVVDVVGMGALATGAILDYVDGLKSPAPVTAARDGR